MVGLEEKKRSRNPLFPRQNVFVKPTVLDTIKEKLLNLFTPRWTTLPDTWSIYDRTFVNFDTPRVRYFWIRYFTVSKSQIQNALSVAYLAVRHSQSSTLVFRVLYYVLIWVTTTLPLNRLTLILISLRKG